MIIRRLLNTYGGSFSKELGITLEGRDPKELFKWFLASILYGARISASIAKRTYWMIEREANTPRRIIETGWDRLVEILDEGGYTRYDFKTARKLIEMAENLEKKFRGDLNVIHDQASSPRELENQLKGLAKGIGNVTVNIFLRELRGIWPKADPPPRNIIVNAAANLGLIEVKSKDLEHYKSILDSLRKIWKESRVYGYTFSDFEATLLRYGLSMKRKNRHLIMSN